MRHSNGDLTYKTRLELARKVFEHTSRYDGLIADYLTKVIQEK
jgi:phosphoribosylaminoimidazolecarboxamide formyltransferase/IMP cyclohydrolase